MELTEEHSPEPQRPAPLEIFEYAVERLKAGDLQNAARYFMSYISAGGPEPKQARSYLEQIGVKALQAGKAYSDARMPRRAREMYKLAADLATGAIAVEARKQLRALTRPTFDEFRFLAPAAGEALFTGAREWRRPHMIPSNPGALSPGEAFDITIFADQSEPQPGEESETFEFPGAEQVYTLQASLLATEHFQFLGPVVLPFEIERGKIETERIIFRGRVAEPERLKQLADAPASLCVSFSYGGRAAGKVQRQIEIAGFTAAAAPASGITASIAIEPGAQAADLTITITAQAENDDRHFWCKVQTALLPEYAKGVTREWVTKTKTGDIVSGILESFAEPGIKPFRRFTRLRGAGLDLFNASPDIFREAFWKLVDADAKPRSIAIVSEEPYIPWELMIPNREGGALAPEYRDPLGVEFQIGRKIGARVASGIQKLKLDKCYVIAPVFDGPASLPHAQEEKQFILDRFSGQAIDPADLQILDTRLASCPSLIHFACHGEVDDRGNQEVYLAEDEPMSALELRGMQGPAKGIPKSRPLVFLNACKAGQPVPALVGAGGLASVFIDLGAGAVIAPLWSVKDTIAHEIALAFYTEAKANGNAPLAAILQRLRAKAYDPAVAEDTYAAYCFYGDPLATAG